MYLKIIEMKGFKSFAEKTRIELNQDFTAIVGPNGSGKSNITEAIKWVLGEQSAKSLRGERMDDVIFAGTETKRRGQYAEVSLEFDNSDHTLAIDQEMVRITRRLTRGGDSNYMINGRNCRLKDITDLMLDTGIGRHSFSVISQGRVEEIFNQRAEERREIFEEAAGVMKYKSRRKDAARKLEHAIDNQNRLDDIIQEIETRLEPLKQQHDDALKYREWTDELQAIDIRVLVTEIETVVAQRKTHDHDLESILSQIKTAQTEQQALKQSLDQTHREKAAAEERQEQLHNHAVTLVEQIEKLQSEKQLAEQRYAFEQQNHQEQSRRLEALDAERERLTNAKTSVIETIASFDQQLTTLKKEKKILDAEIAELQAEATEDVETLRNQYFDALQEQNQLKNAMTRIEQEQSIRKQRASSRQQRQSETKLTQQKLQRAYDDKRSKHEQMMQSLNEAVSTYRQQQQYFEKASKQLYQLKQQTEQVENAMIRSKTTRDSLKSLSDSYEGFYNGVKNALKWGERHNGIAGAVAELISVPERYTRAVEEALGGQMQNIVVQNGDVAEAVIAYLKSSRGGRATFLPLDKIRGRQMAQQTLEEAMRIHGVIGVLSDLVTYDPHLEPIVTYLMGNILVTDTIRTARLVNQKLHRGVRIVTLDGDIVNAGGALTGGRNRHNPQHELLVRNQKIAAEERRLTKFAQERKQCREQLEAQEQQVISLKETLSEAQEQLTTDKQRLNGLQSEAEQFKKQLADINAQIKADQYDESADNDDDQEAIAQLDAHQKRIEAIDREAQNIRAKIENFDQYAKKRQEKLAEWNAKQQTLATKIAIQQEKHIQQQTKQQELDEQLTTVNDNYRVLTERMAANDVEASHYESDQEAREQALTDKKQAREQLLADQQTIKQRIEKMDQSLNDLDQQLTAINAKLTHDYQRQSTLESEVTRDDEKIDTYLSRLSEDYTLTYERAKSEVKPLEKTIPEAKQRMKQLRTAITQLGPVNLQAIDEYNEVSERYQFMSKQREDVLEAVNNLNEAIRSLDNEVKTKFSASFNAIRESFEDIFPKLFNGGKATLALTDPDDLLTTGVEIMAQPPGKQLQLMSLLSGGERSLTAIALLFAIIAVNPVPFSILDEVEAALDDANVDRYGQYLNRYADQTQFIVITHRKGTMVHANVLYGVTMEEAGVSKLAAVKLTDIES